MLLQVCISVFFIASLALRGVSVLFYPYTIGFVALSLANAVVVCTLIFSVSFILVSVGMGLRQSDKLGGNYNATPRSCREAVAYLRRTPLDDAAEASARPQDACSARSCHGMFLCMQLATGASLLGLVQCRALLHMQWQHHPSVSLDGCTALMSLLTATHHP